MEKHIEGSKHQGCNHCVKFLTYCIISKVTQSVECKEDTNIAYIFHNLLPTLFIMHRLHYPNTRVALILHYLKSQPVRRKLC